MQTAQYINLNTVNLISRNTPVALVVGAGSFIGSYLVERLLEKNIQVIGVDKFKNGKREYLGVAIKNRNFHLLGGDEDEIKLNVERLDYLFIFPEKEEDTKKTFNIFKKTKCRALLVSSIDLYKTGADKKLEWLKESEINIAKFAKLNNLNARVLRLGAVFGPRMDFKSNDPINKLIRAAIKEEIQKEVDLDFTTRALYIDDAIELIVKSMLSGATALKIFDGVLPAPIKIAEIKQILLDPIWYEERGFNPTELPPWHTPNLEKTVRQLNWKPKTKIVFALKQTLNYFRTHEVNLPDEEILTLPEEKKELLSKIDQQTKRDEQKEEKKSNKKKAGSVWTGFKNIKGNILIYISIGIIFYALVWPAISLGWGIISFKINISKAGKYLGAGEFGKSINNVNRAEDGVEEAKKILSELELLRSISFFDEALKPYDDLIKLAHYSQVSAKSTVLGIEALYQGLKAVTGEITEGAGSYFSIAQLELAQAEGGFSKAQALTESEQFQKNVPGIFKDQVHNLMKRVAFYEDIVKKGRVSATLLPEIIGLNGNKSYLILLQNNMELRPGGGFIGSFAKLDFEGEKLKKLEVNDVYAIDGRLDLHVEPPQEIKSDLGQKDWYLRDSNYEPDFPTNARQAEWFYTKETGERVDGVIALDISAIENLLKVVGPLDLLDYKERINEDNLFEKAITHAEQGFFPGSQAKKTFLTALTLELLNKVFFLPKQNWPGIVQSLGKSLEEKHLSIYLDDTKLFSYLNSQGWTAEFSRKITKAEDETVDFLAPVEANLGGNKANYYIDRSYKLETAIGKDGEINHRLKISYTNRSPADTWPGGLYKNRLRVYLPFGSRLIEAKWGEEDITQGVSSFTDYGRSGISMLLPVEAKEQKELSLNYQVPEKLKFVNNLAKYKLSVIKQAGTLKDHFEWRISFPINYKVASDKDQISPQEHVVSTDLSSDRDFEISFNKSL